MHPLRQLELENERLRAALAQYADARHWVLRRFDLVYPQAVWIGPGAEEKPVPHPGRVAMEALRPDAEAGDGPVAGDRCVREDRAG